MPRNMFDTIVCTLSQLNDNLTQGGRAVLSTPFSLTAPKFIFLALLMLSE